MRICYNKRITSLRGRLFTVKEDDIVELVQNLKAKVKPLGKKIVLPEYKDERVLEATQLILKEGFATPVLVGNPEEVKAAAQKAGFNIDGAEIIDSENYAKLDQMVEIFTAK